MAINPKELQKFHDLWAPMIASLPAVINAVETAAELERHTLILRTQCDEIIAEGAASKVDMANAVLKAQSELKGIEAEKAEKTKAAAAHAKACQDRIADAEASVNARVIEQAARADAAVAMKANIEKELAERKAKADSEYAEHLNAKRTELEELEAKLLSAQKTLDKLRSKLE